MRPRRRSSATAISHRVLTYLTTGCGIVSFHGPMLDRRLGRGIDAYDRDTFIRALTSPEPLGDLAAPALETFREGEAAGPLVGGTLAQLVASLGTPYAFKPPKGHVLFLEDVAERPYRLDRMLTQLRLAGVLDSASAIVLGEFPDCDEPQRRALRPFGACGPAQGIQRPRRVWFSIRPHDRPARDAAVRRAGAGGRQREPTGDYRRGWGRVTIHFIGVCGTAMATLAALLKRKGHDVQGSDENIYPPMSTFLESEQIRDALRLQRRPHHRRDRSCGRRQRDLAGAMPSSRRCSIASCAYCSLPEAVREQFLWTSRSIVIAGTHGKTTTTSLTGWLLAHAGLDPTILVGGISLNLGEGARAIASVTGGTS